MSMQLFHFDQLEGILYVADFLFLAALATIILKLKLEKSSQGFSAKTQGVYGVVVCTRNIDLLFVDDSFIHLLYGIVKKIINISCIIYIVFKIKTTSKNNTTCNCNQDSFWVEALVLPCIIITAACQYGLSPEEVLWSFSTYLECVAMVPQLYLTHVRGKGDYYLPAYLALMAAYSLTDAIVFSLNSFMYDNMSAIWPICKCIQLSLYAWYLLIPKEAVLPVANCEERRRKTTMFLRQQSLLAQTLLQKNNSSSDLQVFAAASPDSLVPGSLCSSNSQQSFEGLNSRCCKDSPPLSPCIKFDPAMETESFRLKAPKLTLKQLKNKGSLRLNSLPSSPLTPRRVEYLKSVSTFSSFRMLSDSSEDDIKSRINSKIPRKRRMGISLPSSPEPKIKINGTFKSGGTIAGHSYRSKIHHTIKLNRLNNKTPTNNTSLPSSPETSRKSELILKAPSNVPLYRSLSHMPIPHNFNPRLNNRLLTRLDNSKSFDTNNNSSKISVSLVSNPSQIHLSSQKPERPPLPQLKIHQMGFPDGNKPATSETPYTETVTRSLKPKRPPLPKLILCTHETTSEIVERF